MIMILYSLNDSVWFLSFNVLQVLVENGARLGKGGWCIEIKGVGRFHLFGKPSKQNILKMFDSLKNRTTLWFGSPWQFLWTGLLYLQEDNQALDSPFCYFFLEVFAIIHSEGFPINNDCCNSSIFLHSHFPFSKAIYEYE